MYCLNLKQAYLFILYTLTHTTNADDAPVNLNSLRYQELYEEGTWMPVSSWIESVNGPRLGSEKEQVRYVRAVGQKVSWEDGRPGVVVLDHSDGRKRVRVGRASQRSVAEDWDCERGRFRFMQVYDDF